MIPICVFVYIACSWVDLTDGLFIYLSLKQQVVEYLVNFQKDPNSLLLNETLKQ